MKVFHGDYDPKKGKITSHVEDDDDFQCDVCGKRYSNQAGFHKIFIRVMILSHSL